MAQVCMCTKEISDSEIMLEALSINPALKVPPETLALTIFLKFWHKLQTVEIVPDPGFGRISHESLAVLW